MTWSSSLSELATMAAEICIPLSIAVATTVTAISLSERMGTRRRRDSRASAVPPGAHHSY